MVYVWIAVFGGAGSLARFAMQGAVHRFTGAEFPWGTLVVNVTGSFLMGLIARLAMVYPDMSADLRAGLLIGLCGGYTTFSTFSFETFGLVQTGAYGRAAAYIGASVFVSLLATFGGYQLGGRFS